MSKKYCPIIYSYDIESSKVTVNDESAENGVVELQSTYLHGVSSCVYKPLLHETFEAFTNSSGLQYRTFRKYSEISDYFNSLNEWAKENDWKVKIFVHNLSYEFEAMMRNIKFCIDNFNQKEFIAVGTHQPLLAKFGNLEFYDSFKILECKSLETIGKEYGIEKLKETKGGYNQKYYYWTKLPKSEYIYNKRDCDIVLYAICRYMAQFTDVKSVSDILVSNTAMIKREIRLNRNIASDKEVHFTNIKAKSELSRNKEFLPLIQSALAGGYTHANPYVVGKHIENVYCYDAKSMHPSAMWGRKFPYEWKEARPEEFSNLHTVNYNYLSRNGSLSELALNESLLFERPIRRFYIAKVTFNGLKCKRFTGFMYSYISSSKCEDIKGATFDNGKIVNADSLSFTGCDIDYLLIDMLYEYESCECKELVIASKVSFISKPSREGVRYYARKKSGYKKLEKKVENNTAKLEDFNFDGLELYDSEVAKHILQNHDADMVHTSLMASKGGLNGQYGCNAMKPIRAEVGLVGHGETMEWIDKGEMLLQSKSSINVFTDGLYTVAYSRLHLICFCLYISLVGGALPLYHDTDSVYFTNYSGQVEDCIKTFNENILNNSTAKECYSFGIMDADGEYKDFVTWGSKCYCATYEDEITHKIKVKATVAGASKKELSKLFTAVVDSESFDYLIAEYFRPNISYDTTINKKLIRSTPGTRIRGVFEDEFGVKGELDECSITVLSECGYTLRALNNPTVYNYYLWCYNLRGENFLACIPETVSIHNSNYDAFTKRFTEEQYDDYIDASENTKFQILHKYNMIRSDNQCQQEENQ